MRDLLNQSDSFSQVQAPAATEYAENIDVLTEKVDRTMEAKSNLQRLIGTNSVAVMKDNHANHARFMSTVFHFSAFTMLLRVMVWVYRSYHARGFSYEYFREVLETWIGAVEDTLSADAAQSVCAVYRRMLELHDHMVSLAESGHSLTLPDVEALSEASGFLKNLLEGDHTGCIAHGLRFAGSNPSLLRFYQGVIQPSLYRIGTLWETSQISVAQEHLASSIAARVMTAMYLNISLPSERRGKALITSVPNEYHEIGPWMISDALELHGWEIRYLGANTPEDDLFEYLRDFRPDVLALSVTMPFNLQRAAEIVKRLRSDPGFSAVKVLLGGQAVAVNREIGEQLGSDGTADSADDAVRLAETWRKTD
jgi:methanogenic corrinoid protein MtbC1